MLLGVASIAIIAESLAILSFILGGFLWVKSEFEKEHEKIKFILEKVVARDKKKDELLENIVLKIQRQDDKLTDITKYINNVDIHLAKVITGYRIDKISQPIFRHTDDDDDEVTYGGVK